MIKYIISSLVFILLLSACSNRDYGDQDISKIPNALGVDKVSILSSVPSNNIAQSSYINIEFSSFMNANSFLNAEITLKNTQTDIEVEISFSSIENHLYIQPLESLIINQKYRLSIDSNAVDIMGNSMDRAYEKVFTCRENFWEKVEAGETHTMALSRDGELYLWGSNDYNELKTSDDVMKSIPIGIIDSNSSKGFNAGSNTSGIIKDDSSLIIYGKQSLTLNDESLFETLSIGSRHSAIIKNDGTLWSWGKDNYGQLGDAGITTKSYLVQENSLSDNWVEVTAAKDFSIALKDDGTMWGWGTNTYGQIGNSEYNERRVPVQEDTNASDWKSISAGDNHSVAIKDDKSLWSWGYNESGELGDASNISSRVSVRESSDSNWSDASAGANHTLAIKENGTLWAWGSNYYGQLGDNSVEDKNIPTLISSDKWRSVSGGTNFSVGVKMDGTMWAWGYNAQNQLGLGDDSEDKLIPTEIK